MAGWDQVAWRFLSVWAQPLCDAAVLLALWFYLRQVRTERSLHGVKLSSAGERLALSLVSGICAGILATAVLAVFRVPVDGRALAGASAAAVVLGMWKSRWFGAAYGAGVVSLLSLAARPIPREWIPERVAGWWDVWAHLDVPSTMAVVAILSLVEAVLVAAVGHLRATPMVLQGRRGHSVGGFLLQQFWVVPLVAAAPTAGSPILLWPVYGAGPTGPLAVPVVLGFQNIAAARTPVERDRRTALALLGYGAVLLGLSLLAARFPDLAWLPAVFAPLAREWMTDWQVREELAGPPRFTRSAQGVQVLAVIPGTPAWEMGLVSGDTVVTVNGRPVDSPVSLYEALREKPAFVRMEVRSPDGDMRICSRSRFEGDPYLLGIIPTPGPDDVPFACASTVRGVGWIQTLRRWLRRGRTRGSTRLRGDA